MAATAFLRPSVTVLAAVQSSSRDDVIGARRTEKSEERERSPTLLREEGRG